MARINRGGWRGSLQKLGLNPGKTTLGQGTGEEEVLEILGVVTAKAGGRNGITEGRETHRGVQDPMSSLPIEVRHTAVKRKEKERPPGSGPMETTKRREELRATRSCLPDQKKENTSLLSSAMTQAGI